MAARFVLSPTAIFFSYARKEYGKKSAPRRGHTVASPPWNHPHADKVTTLHLRTSANYCLCLALIPPWRCRHFVGGFILRYAAAAFKASLV